MPESADDWLANAEEHPGSWWTDWHQWMAEKSGNQGKALVPGTSKSYPALYPAPGHYVLKRLA